MDPADTRVNHSRFLVVLAAMRPGVTVGQVNAEMDALGDRLEQADPVLNRGWRPSVFPLRDELAGPVEKPLEVLMGAVGFLLLMACVNVANLLLARAGTRRREIAIRMAMGAGRGHIVRQLLAESVMLSLAGGALGLLLAWGGIALVRHLGPASMPRLAAASLDWRVFLFALAISVVTGLLFGLAPALQSSDTKLNTALVEDGRGRTAARSGRMLRNALVAAEVALAVLVLIGATLLIRSFVRLRSVDLGFQPDGVLTLRLPLAGERNAKSERRVAFLQQVQDRVAALPGMRSVAAVDTLPLGGFGYAAMFAAEGRPAPANKPIALVRGVTPGYFRNHGSAPAGGPRLHHRRHQRRSLKNDREPPRGAPLLASGWRPGKPPGARPARPARRNRRRGGRCQTGDHRRHRLADPLLPLRAERIPQHDADPA